MRCNQCFFSPNVVTSIFCREENHRSGYFRSSASHADSRRLEGLSQHCFCHQLLSQSWSYYVFWMYFLILYLYFVFNCFVFCILYLKAFPSAAFAINFFPKVSQQSRRVSQHILFCQIISPRHFFSLPDMCTASLTMGVKAMLPQVNWCLCSGDVQCLHMIINNDNI